MTFEGEPVYAETHCNSVCYFASIIGYGDVVFIDDPDTKCEALSIKHQTGKEVIFTVGQTQGKRIIKNLNFAEKTHHGQSA
jgi:hypothetical protein